MKNVLYVMENKSDMNGIVSMQRSVSSMLLAEHKVFVLSTSNIPADYIPNGVSGIFNPTVNKVMYPGSPQSLDAVWIARGAADLVTITQLCSIYGTLVSKYGVDVIVADSSPIVQLFAYAKKVPIVTVQSALAFPPVHVYQRGLAAGARVLSADSVALEVAMNTYLTSKGVPAINDMSDICTGWGTHLTTSHKVMDPYCIANDFTRELNYMPAISGVLSTPAPQWRKENVPNVVVYSDYNKRIIPGIITQLLLADNANIVLVSDDVYIISQLASDLRSQVTWLRSPATNLIDYTTTADLLICNGDEVTVSEAVKSGIPVIAIPVQYSQIDTADWLVSNGIGLELLNSLDTTKVLADMMTGLSTYSANCKAYALANMTESTDALAALITAVS